MGSFANSVDPHNMPQDVAIHQGLHYLLRQEMLFREIHTIVSSHTIIFHYNITCDPLIHVHLIYHSNFIVLNQMEEVISV